MDKDKSKVIDDFEFMLKKQTSKKPLRLYSSSETQNKCKIGHGAYSIKEVLLSVSKQIKDIQNADLPSSKRSGIRYEYKKKEFLTMDMITASKEVSYVL